MNWGDTITYLGNTALKGVQVKFGMKDADRLHHMCVLGKAEQERVQLVVNIALQDISRNIPTVVIDAGGEVSRMIVERLGPDEIGRLVFLEPGEAEYPYALNPVEEIRKLPDSEQGKKMSDVLRSVYRISASSFVRHTADLLLEKKGTTLLTFYSLVLDAKARARFFGDDTEAKERFEDVLSKEVQLQEDLAEHGKYIAKDTLVRNVFGQVESKFSIVPDGGETTSSKIVIVDVSRIRMYPTRITPFVRVWVELARVAGRVAGSPVSLLLQDTLRYLGEEEVERTFSSKDVALTVADASFGEAEKEKREQALSRCGSISSFAAHSSDRSLIERAFYPYVDPEELEHVEEGEMLIALTIDAVRSKPFFAKALPLPPKKSASYQDVLVESRTKYTRSRSEVDELLRTQVSAGEDDDDEDDEDGDEGGSGSFSDTFRSIFNPQAKQDGSPTPAVSPPSPGAAPSAPSASGTPSAPKAEEGSQSKEKETEEIPEDELKQMLYVHPRLA